MSITKAICENTKEISREDNFEPDESNGLHFPCCACIRGGNELTPECQNCRYFFN